MKNFKSKLKIEDKQLIKTFARQWINLSLSHYGYSHLFNKTAKATTAKELLNPISYLLTNPIHEKQKQSPKDSK
jgi:hypothetical protein